MGRYRLLVLDFQIQSFVDERQYVSGFFDFFGRRFASTMTGFAVYAQQHRIQLVLVVPQHMMQVGGKFQRMQRTHAIVVVGGQNQCGRILIVLGGGTTNIMQWRIFEQVIEMFFHIWAAIVAAPSVTNGEFVETQHVQHAHLRYRSAEQIGPLIDAGANQKTSIGATLNDQLLAFGVFVLDEVLSGRLKIIENILFVEQTAAVVPFLAIFTTAANIRTGQYTIKGLDEHQHGHTERRLNGDVEATVAVQQTRLWFSRCVFLELTLHGEHGYFGAVTAGIEHLLDFVVMLVESFEFQLDLTQHRRLDVGLGKIVLVNGACARESIDLDLIECG